jgi:hypothetical protein
MGRTAAEPVRKRGKFEKRRGGYAGFSGTVSLRNTARRSEKMTSGLMRRLAGFFKAGKPEPCKSESPSVAASMPDVSTAHEEPLRVGWIVRFKSPDVDFNQALAAGQDRMDEYFSDAIGGLRVGHVEELRRLGFFSAIKERTGLDVDVGSWEAIPARDLALVAQVIADIIPQATPGMRNLLEDFRDLMGSAEADGCPVGFMLAI